MKTRAGKVIMVCAQKPVVTFWKRNGASRESFYCNVIFGRVVQGRGSLVTKLHVGEGSARVSHRSERCVCPPLNSLSGSGCTLLLVRMFVWRLRVWAWKAATPSWRLSLASLAEADTQREGNRRKPTMTLCFLVPLCVISIWGGLYNGQMWVLTTGPSAGPLCSLRNIPALPFTLFFSSTYIFHNLFSLSWPNSLTPFHAVLFRILRTLSCFGSPSCFMVISGRNEDAVVMLWDYIIHTTRSTILK